MSERIVVCYYSRRVSVRAPEQANHLQTARALSKRAAARGGNLIAWGARSLAFDFDFDAVEDVIELCCEDARDPDIAYGIGVAQGELEPIDEMAAGYSLGWGPGLVRAEALARVARAGEVLLDSGLDPIRSGDLLTQGARIRVLGRERLRGQRLDLQHPWRADLALLVSDLMTPLLIGRPQLGEMLVPAGSAGVIRADRGFGGSRFLGELARTLEPARVLRLSPSAVGEPFGALRRGLLKARSRGQAPAVLDGVHAESLESLLVGEGLDLESCAGLLCAWLAPAGARGPSGAVLLDDVHDIDSDTQEAIRVAIEDMPFRLIMRCAEAESVPEAFNDLPLVVDVRLGPLSTREASELAKAWLNDELEPAMAERFARAGDGNPLAIAEAIAEALEGGELVWEDRRAIARVRRAGRGGPKSAVHWIVARAQHLDAAPRAVLFALAVLGGEADSQDVCDLVKRSSAVALEFERVVRALEATRWLRRPAPELLSLPSASHRDAVLSMLSSQRSAEWHLEAAVVLANNNRPLCAASAAAHAMLGGDLDSAVKLAQRAAASARAIDLADTAAALDSFGAQRDPAELTGRGVSISIFPVDSPSRQRIPSHALPSDPSPPPRAGSARPSAPARSPLAAPRLPGPDVLAFAAGGVPSTPGVRRPALAQPLSAAAPPPLTDRRPRGQPPRAAAEDSPGGVAPQPQRAGQSSVMLPRAAALPSAAARPGATPPQRATASAGASKHKPPAVARPALGISPPRAPGPVAPPTQHSGSPIKHTDSTSDELPEIEVDDLDLIEEPSAAVRNELALRATDLLRSSDWAGASELAAELRKTRRHLALADRLDALVKLGRGEAGEALGSLKRAAEAATASASGDRCRAALVHAIGLSVAGRNAEALLEALSALAFARASGDQRGEHACARFIAQLCEAGGYVSSGEVWLGVAQTLAANAGARATA